MTQTLYAHQGEMLDFRLPEVFAEEPMWSRSTDSRPGGIPHLEQGNVETVNAQGVSRTEEMWVFLSGEDSDSPDATKFLEGLDRERLRAVADPAWVAQSRALKEIHHRDEDQWFAVERLQILVQSAGGCGEFLR